MPTHKGIHRIQKSFATSVMVVLTLMLLLSTVTPTLAKQYKISSGGSISATPAQAQGPIDPAEMEAFLDELMAKDMEEYNIPGAAVSVVKDGVLFFAKGYGLGWYGGLAMATLNWGVLMVFWGNNSETTCLVYGSIGAVIMFLAIFGSSVGLHAYLPYLHSPPSRSNFLIANFVGELKQTLRNRNFAALFFAGLFAAVGAGVSTNFDTYIVTHFWEFTPEQWRWGIISLFISALLPIYITPVITARHGTRNAVRSTFMVSRSCSLRCRSSCAWQVGARPPAGPRHAYRRQDRRAAGGAA